MQTILSWIDGPFISKGIGTVVAGIVAFLAVHVFNLTADQSAQLSGALTTILTVVVYELTHNGLKVASTVAGNADAGK